MNWIIHELSDAETVHEMPFVVHGLFMKMVHELFMNFSDFLCRKTIEPDQGLKTNVIGRINLLFPVFRGWLGQAMVLDKFQCQREFG